MAENSKIEWTTHTFNPWWGCTNVSPACDNCYAETFAKRMGTGWGKDARRRFFGDKHWNEPLKWNRLAEDATERPRVFVASMADVLETLPVKHPDRAPMEQARLRLWQLIEDTPNLIYLMLTKRPENFPKYVPAEWMKAWPENVWPMTTVENQLWAKPRIEALLKTPAKVHGLSMEPLFGFVDLSPWIHDLEWVITGGESGHGARPANPDWYRSLRDQAVSANVPFLFKQWGNWGPVMKPPYPVTKIDGEAIVGIGHYKDKHDAGRVLDHRTWDEYPKGAAA